MLTLTPALSVAQGDVPPEPDGAGEQSTDEGTAPEATEEKKEVLPSLDEAKPFEWSWKSLAGVVTGRDTYAAHDGRVVFRLGVSVQLDGTTARESDMLESYYGTIPSSVDLRRLMLSSHGHIREMNFKVSVNLGTDLGIKDFWFEGRKGGLALWDTLLGKFRFGHVREPFSLERQTGSNYTGFMERSLPAQTFAPGRNLGALVHDTSANGRVHWAAGLFSLGDSNQDGQNSSLFSITGRCTGLPIYEDDGKRLLHVGASVSGRNPTSDTRYFSRPEARFVQPLADTGGIDASSITLLGAELAGVYGPWWAQAEWIHSHLEAPQVGNPDFDGGYLQVGYILTGGSRPYQKSWGIFDRYRYGEQSDHAKFVDRSHEGAWEVVGRVSRTDLTDAGVDGGELTDYSVALSWYPSWATRVQLNYIFANPQDQGSANILLLRLQYSPW